MSNNSWKQYGGIDQVNSFNVLNVERVITNTFINRAERSNQQFFDGSLEVTVDFIAQNNVYSGNNIIIRNSISTIVDVFVNRDKYLNNRMYFFTTDRTSDVSTVDLSLIRPFDTSHAFIKGNNSNIGVNITNPESVFHISSHLENTSDVLIFESSNNYIRNILSQNKNQRGIVFDASDANSNIFIFNDVSTNIANEPNASIQYASGGFLTLQTKDLIEKNAQSILFTNSGGFFSIDTSGTRMHSINNINLDTSDSLVIDTSSGFFILDTSTSMLHMGTSGDFILNSSSQKNLFSLNQEKAILNASGGIILNASSGFFDINATKTGVVNLNAAKFILNSIANFTPFIRDLSAIKMYDETLTVYDSSNTQFLPNVYDLSQVQTGTAITSIAIDASSTTNAHFVTPDTGKGLELIGGVYPLDTNRSMNFIGTRDLCNGFMPSQLIVSSNDPSKFLSTLGINTYQPKLDEYIMNINGPIRIANGEINPIVDINFEIKNMHFSRSHTNVGIAVGSPSSIIDGSYHQFVLYSTDGGQNWNSSNVYEKEHSNETDEDTLNNTSNTFTECFMIDNSYGLISGNNSAFYYTNNGAVDWYRLGYGPSYETVVSTALAGHKVTIEGNPIYRFYNAFQGANYKSKIRMFDISQSHIDASLNGQSDILQHANEFDTSGQSIENITSMDVSENHLYIVGNTGIEKLDVSANIVTFPSANTTYHRTASSSGVGPGINQLQYNNIRSFNDTSILAVGNNLLSVSTDGTNWTDVSINMINNIGDVSLNQSFILDTSNAIAVGNKGTFLYSRNWPDVNSWQRFSPGLVNGTENRLIDISNQLTGVYMSDLNNVIVASATSKYNNTNLGTSSMLNMFVPRLFNEKNNNILEVSGNMILTGDLRVEGTTFANEFNYKPLDATDISGDLNIGKNTTFTSFGFSNSPEDIFTNIGDPNKGIRTLPGNYQVINFGANTPTIANQQPAYIFNIGNHQPFMGGVGQKTNAIFLGGGSDNVILDGSGIIFKTQQDLQVNSKHISFNAADGNLPDTGGNCGIQIKCDGDSAAGFIESSKDRTGYLFRAPSASRNFPQNIFKIDASNMVLTDSSNVNPTLGIHSIDRGIISLTKIPEANNDGSFNMVVEQFDISNILLRDSDINFSNNQNQRIKTGLIVHKDVSLNNRLFVSNDGSFNQSLHIGTNIFDLSGKLRVTNDASLNKDLTVFGESILMKDVSINNTLFVNNDVSLNNRIFVLKDSIFEDVSMNSRLFVENDVSFNNNLFVRENSILNGDVSFGGVLTVSNDMFIGGNLTVEQFQNTDIFTTTSTNYNFLSIQEDLSLNGRMFVRDDISFNNRLFVAENSILMKDVSLNSRLYVGDDASFNKRLFVSALTNMKKDVSMNNRLHIGKDADFKKHLFVKDGSIFDSDVTMKARLFVDEDVSFNANLFVNEKFVSANDLSLNNRLFAKDGSFNSDVFIDMSLGINVHNPILPFEINKTDAIKIPKGTSSERPNANSVYEKGYIRFNTTIQQFEVYGSDLSWVLLEGVTDLDKDTFIQAETSSGANNNELQFFTAGVERMKIDSSKNIFVKDNLFANEKTIFEADLSINNRLFSKEDVSFNQSLFVNNLTVLNADVSMNNNLFVNKDVSFNKMLYVTGKTIIDQDLSTNSLHVLGDVSLNQTLYTHSDKVESKGKLIAMSDVSINNNLSVELDVSFNKKLYVKSNLGIGTENPVVSLQIEKTDAIGLPRGTTAERPTYPEKGHMRYNTTDEKFESYSGSSWSVLGGGGGDQDGDTTIRSGGSTGTDFQFVLANDVKMSVLGGGDVSMSNLFVHKTTSYAGDLSINTGLDVANDAEINGTLFIGENSNIGNDVSFNGDLTVSKNIFIDGQVQSNNIKDINTTLPSDVTFTTGRTNFTTSHSTTSNFTGAAASDYFGDGTACNKDGSIIAISAPGSSNGDVYIYKKIGNSYSLLGTNVYSIRGDGQNDCKVLSLNAEGNIIAIGNWKENNNDRGHARTYIYNSTTNTWDFYGQEILGSAANVRMGGAVSLNDAGNILAVGAYGEPDNNLGSFVNVYTIISNTWTLLGGSITGPANSRFGLSVSLNSSGTRVCIGATVANLRAEDNMNPTSAENQVGMVRVYEYNSNKTTTVTDLSSEFFGPVGWNRVATDIFGIGWDERFGQCVDINGEGNIIAASTYQNGGRVRAYQVDLSYTTPLSETIERLTVETNVYVVTDGESNKYTFNGNSIYKNYYGLGKGSYTFKNVPASHPMAVISQDPSNITLNQVGNIIVGDEEDSYLNSCALNGLGNIIATGQRAYHESGGGDNAANQKGRVKVFRYTPASEYTAVTATAYDPAQSPAGWTLMGSEFSPTQENGNNVYLRGNLGKAVHLNYDGTILAFSEPYWGNSNNDYHGRVQVHKYDKSTNQWFQLGGKIDTYTQNNTDNVYEVMGEAGIRLDASGGMICIPHPRGVANNNSTDFDDWGLVRVYRFDITKTLTTDPRFVTAPYNSTWYVPTYDDIASGYGWGDGKTERYVYGHYWTPTVHYGPVQWTRLGGDIIGKPRTYLYPGPSSQQPLFGHKGVEMSKDGQIVLSGAGQARDRFYKNDASNRGYVMAFKYADNFATDLSSSYQILDERTNVGVVDSNGNKYTLNNSSTYVENYVVSKGLYVLKNVPSSHPITVINPPTPFITDWKLSYYLRNQENSSRTFDHGVFGSGQQFGSTFAFNDTGDMAIIAGARFQTDRGVVFPMKKINGVWYRSNSVYYGVTSESDYLGWTVAINGDGTIWAFSRPWLTSNRGRTQVYKYNEDGDSQFQGGTFTNILNTYSVNSTNNEYNGYTGTHLNSKGDIIAIGSLHSDVNGSDSGKVTVYKDTGSGDTVITNSDTDRWKLYGSIIEGNFGSLQYCSTRTTFQGDQLWGFSLNSEGNIVAITMRYFKGSGIGGAIVYKYDATKSIEDTDETSINFGPVNWKKLGDLIIGSNENGNTGDNVLHRCKIDGSGNRLIVSQRNNDEIASDAGLTNVYELNTSFTSSTGTDVELINPNSQVSIVSSSGNKYTFNNNTSYKQYYGLSRGKYIFQNIPQSHPMAIISSKTTLAPANANYRQIGQDVYNTSYGVQNFVSAMNKDGTVIAVQHNGTSNLGYVRVLEYIRGTWTQRGQVLQGHATSAYLGRHSISLNDDGTIIAMSYAHWSSSRGYVRIFQFFVPGLDGTAVGAWSELTTMNSTYGSELYGDSTNSEYGSSIQLNGAGNIIVIAERYFDATNNNSGRVRVYEYSLPGSVGGAWNQKGANHIFASGTVRNIDQSSIPPSDNYFGWDVKINRAGTVIAVASLKPLGFFNSEGGIQTFAWNGTDWIEYGGGTQMYGDGDIHYMGIPNDAGESAISMNHDGTIIAAGSKDFSYAKVWKFSDSTNFLSDGYTLRGSEINGLTTEEYSGRSVSINSDGTVVAIGAYAFDGGAGQDSGTTRIYEWNGTGWVLKGSQINGLTVGEQTGISVSINSAGTIVAIGARYFSGGAGTNSGTTRIYEWNGTAWVLKGSQINGLTSGEESGYRVSINSAGTIVVIGAYRNDDAGQWNYGTTRIYEWNGTAWALKGSQINGLTSGEYSGTSVSINSTGTIVAIGVYAYNSSTGTTRIYEWNGTAWTLKGSQIDGLTSGERFGYNVSLNNDGTVIVIGAHYYNSETGTTRIYEWNGTAWALKGNQIDGFTSGERFGHNVSINGDGTIVAIGAYKYNSSIGTTRIYKWNGTVWRLKNQINGLTPEEFGWSVSLSDNGKTVAIGGSQYDFGTGTNSGITRIYHSISNTGGGDGTYQLLGGTPIYGPGMRSIFFGNNVSLDASGYTIAISSRYETTAAYPDLGSYSATDHRPGGARIYKYSDPTSMTGIWTLDTRIVGNSIYDNEAENGPELGRGTHLNDDGTIVLLTSRYYNVYSSGSRIINGVAKVYSTRYFTYSGDSDKKLVKQVNGVNYDFYYGDICLEVINDFDYASIYCYYHGYMGGQNMLRYFTQSWDIIGKFYGEQVNAYAGYGSDAYYSADISKDGSTIAYQDYSHVSNIFGRNYSTANTGVVKAFKYRTLTHSEWSFGNKDGLIQRPGVPVIIDPSYSYVENKYYWVQIGNNIYENINNDSNSANFGKGVKLNPNGTEIYTGNTAYSSSRGQMQIFTTNPIEITGTTSYVKSVDDVSYNFYSGDVVMQVHQKFDKASLYCYYHGYMGGKDMLRYYDPSWNAMGNEIWGDADGSQAAECAMNEDGTVIAAGGTIYDITGSAFAYDDITSAGYFRVFEPKKLYTTDPSDGIIPLKKEGKVNIVFNNGENKYALNNSYTYQHSFELEKGTYTFKDIPQSHPLAIIRSRSSIISGRSTPTLLGNMLISQSTDYNQTYGWATAINNAGTVVAVSEVYSDAYGSGSNNNEGHVNIYQYNEGLWVPMGGALQGYSTATGYRTNGVAGSANYLNYGHAISLNASGDIIAASVGQTNGGLIRVYQYKLLTQAEWENGNKNSYQPTQTLGVPIIVTTPHRDYNDGSHVNTTPLANFTKYDPVKKYWIQLGDDIVGGTSRGNATAGTSIQISKDGYTLISGQPEGWYNGTAVAGGYTPQRRNYNGKVFIYKYSTPGFTGGTWKEVNATSDLFYISDSYNPSSNGEGALSTGTIAGDWYDYAGISVSCNDDASIIAVGSHRYDPLTDTTDTGTRNGSNTRYGKVLTYKYNKPGNCYVRFGNEINEYDFYRVEGLKYSWDFRLGKLSSTIDEISGVRASYYDYFQLENSNNGVNINGTAGEFIQTEKEIYISTEASIEFYIHYAGSSGTNKPNLITLLDDSNDGFVFQNVNQQYVETAGNNDNPHGVNYSGNTSAQTFTGNMTGAKGLSAVDFYPGYPISTLLTNNTWTHIVYVYDHEGIKIYKNGSLHFSRSSAYGTHDDGSLPSYLYGETPSNISNVARRLTISDNLTNTLQIRYLRIYDKAISGSDISILYENRDVKRNFYKSDSKNWLGFTKYYIGKYFGKNVSLNRDGKTILVGQWYRDYVRNFKVDNSFNYTSYVNSSIETLNESSSVSVVNSGGNKYTFNGNSSYQQYYGVTNGYYTMNVPANDAIAFVPSSSNFKQLGPTFDAWKLFRGNGVYLGGTGFAYGSTGGIFEYSFINSGSGTYSTPSSANTIPNKSSSTLSLNKDGTVLAIGSPKFQTRTGCIIVFRLLAGSWVQLGGIIYNFGLSAQTIDMGFSVSLNNKGNILAGGAPYWNTGKGRVGVWKYSNADLSPGGYWINIHNATATSIGPSNQNSVDFGNNSRQNRFGYQVRLNGTGERLFITQPGNEYCINGVHNSNTPAGEIVTSSGSQQMMGWVYSFDYTDATISSSTYDSNLIAHYKFENNGNDSSTNNYTLIQKVGGLTYSQGTARDPISYWANGTSTTASNWALSPNLNQNVPITVAFWFRTTGTGYYTILGYGDPFTTPGINIDYSGTTLISSIAIPTTWSSINVTGLSINVWYHYILTITDSYLATVYINGVKRGTIQGSAPLRQRGHLHITNAGDNARGYEGDIGDLRVYNKVLSDGEAAYLANSVGADITFPGNWSNSGYFVPGNHTSGDFGFAGTDIAINEAGTVAVIGIPGASSFTGKIEVYNYSNPSGNTWERWSKISEFNRPTTMTNAGSLFFGFNVDMDGTGSIIAASNGDIASNTNKMYIKFWKWSNGTDFSSGSYQEMTEFGPVTSRSTEIGTNTYDSNLIAHYKFENNGNDSSTNNYTLTQINGGLTYSTGTAGDPISYWANGTSSTNSNWARSPNLNQNVPITLAFWFRVTGTGSYTILGYGNSSTSPGFNIDINASNGTFISYIALPTLWNAAITLGTGFTKNVWYHYTLTITDSYLATIYINGTKQGIAQGTGALPQSGYLHITNAGDNARGYEGDIGDLRVYNKALSGAEVANLANSVGSGSSDVRLFFSIDSSANNLVVGNLLDGSGSLINKSTGSVKHYTYSTPGSNGGTFTNETFITDGEYENSYSPGSACMGESVRISKDGTTITASASMARPRVSRCDNGNNSGSTYTQQSGIVKVFSNKHFSYTGMQTKKYTSQISGVNHDFYYGDISFNVHADFDNLSVYSYNSNSPVSYGSNMIRYYQDASTWKQKGTRIHHEHIIKNNSNGGLHSNSTSDVRHFGGNHKETANRSSAINASGDIILIGCSNSNGPWATETNVGSIHSYQYRKITLDEWNNRELIQYTEVSPRFKAIHDWDFHVSTPSENYILDSIGGLKAYYEGGITSTVSSGARLTAAGQYINLEPFLFGNANFTFEYLFKIHTVTSTYYAHFLDFKNRYILNTNLYTRFHMYIHYGGIMVTHTNRDHTSGGHKQQDLRSLWKRGDYIHLVISYNKDTNKRQYYVNGEFYEEVAVNTPSYNTNSGDFYIERCKRQLNILGDVDGHLKGNILNFRVWDYALQDSEAFALYNERFSNTTITYNDISNNNFWIKNCDTIHGTRANDLLGFSVAMNEDGSVIMGGRDGGDGSSQQRLAVYSIKDLYYAGHQDQMVVKQVNNISYNFYYGNVTLTVAGNFDKASLYCYNHGYMGGQNMLRYVDQSFNQLGNTFRGTFHDEKMGRCTMNAKGDLLMVGSHTDLSFNDGANGLVNFVDQGAIQFYEYRLLSESEWNGNNKLDNSIKTSAALKNLLSIPGSKRFNWDFRVLASTGITDSWNSIAASYSTLTTSSTENGAKIFDSDTDAIDFADCTFGGSFSMEFYFRLNEIPNGTSESQFATDSYLYSTNRLLQIWNTSLQTDPNPFVNGSGSGELPDGWWQYINNTIEIMTEGNNLQVKFGQDYGKGFTESGSSLRPRGVTDGVHVVFSVENTECKMYVNGSLSSSGTITYNPHEYDSNGNYYPQPKTPSPQAYGVRTKFTIGGDRHGEWYGANIYCLRIWQDHVISLDEACTLYTHRDSSYFRSLMANTYVPSTNNLRIIAGEDRTKSYSDISNNKYWIQRGNERFTKQLTLNDGYGTNLGNAYNVMNNKGDIFASTAQYADVDEQGNLKAGNDGAHKDRGAAVVFTERSIVYGGDLDKISSKEITGTVNDGSYNFYYGDLQVGVLNDFNFASVYCYNHGYMGGENMLRYGKNSWLQIGNDISHNHGVGEFMKLNKLGNFIATGMSYHSGSNNGTLRFYQYNDVSWNQISETITGTDSDGYLGRPVADTTFLVVNSSCLAINDAGTIVIIGEPRRNANGSDAGQAYVFELNHIVNSYVTTPMPVIDASRVVTSLIGINADIDPNYAMNIRGPVQSTFYNATSDERMKTNIEVIENSLSMVENLRGVSYNWKYDNTSQKQYGFIAQELETIVPEAVSSSSIPNEHGFTAKNINYFSLLPLLVESIKTLSQENEELEDDVALLEHTLYKLNNK